MRSIDCDSAPDIETASEGYSRRFCGEIGQFFLDTQRLAIFSLLRKNGGPLSILEVGGGHGQLAAPLLEAGHHVWVHASHPEALSRLLPLRASYPDRLHLVVSSIFSLPFAGKSFDAVIAIRLISHVARWQDLLNEMSRLSRKHLIFDFPPAGSFNLLYPFLFHIKKRIEGNTRPYLRFRFQDVRRALLAAHFNLIEDRREFLLPMVIHRFLKLPKFSKRLELIFAAAGITRLFGSPTVVLAENVLETLL